MAYRVSYAVRLGADVNRDILEKHVAVREGDDASTGSDQSEIDLDLPTPQGRGEVALLKLIGAGPCVSEQGRGQAPGISYKCQATKGQVKYAKLTHVREIRNLARFSDRCQDLTVLYVF